MDRRIWEQLGQQFGTLPERLGGHILLTVAALAVGIAASLPLGILATRRPRLERVALLLASIVQTIPGLALLALMVFVWGTIGWIPALIALILYSLLPILRNTIAGLKGLDPALLEAARGVGMNDRQMLWLVQLPLALPIIVAGIRTASVWVVGAATIAQPVGATSLGNYIFVGLQTSNPVSLAFGCLLSAGLALVLDGLWRGMEVALERRSVARGAGMAAGMALLIVSPLLIACLPWTGELRLADWGPRGQGPESGRFVIGSKAFTEQYIWADVFRQRLESQGLEVQVLDGMGSATVFEALAKGQIDCYVDYTGTIWSNYMRRTETVPPVEMLLDVTTYLKQERQIYCLGSLGFSNDYAFATRRELADRYELKSLVDLARVADQLTSGMDIEFLDRPEWAAVRRAYGFDFRRKLTMDATLMYGAMASGQLDVIVAFNSDGRLERNDLVVLEDPAYALPPYDAVLLVSPRLARHPAAMKALRPLIQSTNVRQMRLANGMVDIDGRSISEASGYLLRGMSAGHQSAELRSGSGNR